jgi:hypothetical protein
MIDVLSAGRRISIERTDARPVDELWLSHDELERASGWKLAAEGLCQASVCMPLSDDARRGIVDGDAIHVSKLWPALGKPLLHDAAHTTWMLGEAAEDRTRALTSLQAPDFTLPDVDGRLHSLSDYRGRKVLLATWASW